MHMWTGVDAQFLCQHHIGEHMELHSHCWRWEKHHKVDGYIRNNCLEIPSYKARHDELAVEIDRRNPGGHKSPLEQPDFSYLPVDQREYQIDRDANRIALMDRCWDCRQGILRKKSFW